MASAFLPGGWALHMAKSMMPNDGALAKVSVLLPTFNRAHYIGAAISSLLSQLHKPFEIIVLDDGSTDDTAARCHSFGDRVNYVPIADNGGKTAAINLGISLARGDFIWIMDDDDFVLPAALSILLAPLLADEGLGFSFGALRKFSMSEDGRIHFDEAGARPPGPSSLFAHLMEDCFITGQPCTLFRRSCLESLAPFDTSVLSSVDYNILLQVARFHGGVDVGKVVLWQRQHGGDRGPAAMRYAATTRIERWREFDQRLIAGLMDQMELREYLGFGELQQPLTSRQVRSALVQKAVIAGRKELWTVAIDTLREAVAADPGQPFQPRDLEALTRMLGSRYGIGMLLREPALQTSLAEAAGGGWAGDEARIAIASLLTFWVREAVRKGNLAAALGCIRAMVRIASVRGAMILLARVATRRVGAIGLPRSAARALRGAAYAPE